MQKLFSFFPYHILLPTPLFQLFFTLFPLLLFLLGPGANGGKEGFGIVKSFPPRLFILHGGEGEEERF